MKATGIVRNLDQLGRIVIPKEIRKVLDIEVGDPVEIARVNNDIVVRRYNKGCIFCGSDKGISEFKNSLVCEECKGELR